MAEKKYTYYCNLPTELILDFPRLDRIRSILRDDLVEICGGGKKSNHWHPRDGFDDQGPIKKESSLTFDAHLASSVCRRMS